jgi:DNA sulfur modification protein DndD
MIFKSVRLKNFRQYKDEMTFDFSLPSDNGKNNITLFVAANGVGKTTLLQAVRYCFYGSSNYLNLPKSNELINNILVDELKELEKDDLFVEVAFSHNNVDYLARRQKVFVKQGGHLKEEGREAFTLSHQTTTQGWKEFDEDLAIDRIRSIIPEGLSQVFMFDGERMETNISDRAFSRELKESILGILNIKQYDKLIQVIGHPGKTSTVLGMLNNRKKANTPEDKNKKNMYEKLLEKIQDVNEKYEENNNQIEEIDQKINITKEQQNRLKEIKELKDESDEIEEEIKKTKVNLEMKASEYVRKAKFAIVHKLMLQNKKNYDDFLKKNDKKNVFYEHLHVNTIEDIINKKVCLCGRPIDAHSPELERLNNLKSTSLPIESAQHVSLINQKFNKAAEYKSIMDILNILKESMSEIKKEIRRKKTEHNLKIKDIEKKESQAGVENQVEINALIESKQEYSKESGRLENERTQYEKAIRVLQKDIDKMDDMSEYNKKINHVMERVNSIKKQLEAIRDQKDNNARKVLSKHFDESLNHIMTGSYRVNINNLYNIKITDLSTEKDVTTSLSTGQNVVVSLTFIDALIKTAKQLSNSIDDDEKYGVMMDAALSNLDEVHIDKLCRYNLNNIDQLIFLSFKRQLRNEMYEGIKSHIGKAYALTKNNSGIIQKQHLDDLELDEYIHRIEEAEEE